MNEISVNVKQEPGKITWNFEEIKTNLEAALAEYTGMVYDDDSIKSARVMKKEVGRWIPPGVGEGIEEEMPELYDQTDEEMAKLAEHMQAAVDVETGKITVRSKAKAEHTADTEMPAGGDTYIDEHIEQENNYHTPVATPSEVSKAQREAARKLLGGVK